MDNYHLKRCLRASVFPVCPVAAYSADVHSQLLLKTGDSLAPLLAISTKLSCLIEICILLPSANRCVAEHTHDHKQNWHFSHLAVFLLAPVHGSFITGENIK